MRYMVVIDLAVIGFICISVIASLASANTAADLKIKMPVESTYKAYCANCHEEKNLIDYDKSDEELLPVINTGSANMPGYGWLLDSENSARILEYIKERTK